VFRESLNGGMSMSVFGIATSSCEILYMFYHVTNARGVMIMVSNIPSSPALYLFKLNYVFFGVWVPYRTGIFK